jgi:hypothetical protein
MSATPARTSSGREATPRRPSAEAPATGRPRPHCAGACALALALLLTCAAAAAAEARISGFRVDLDDNQVLASLTLVKAFNHRFLERIESGLPTAIFYRFELDRDRKHWWDRRLKTNTLEIVATYDAVERAYTVHFKLDDKLVESRTLHDRQALEAAMTRVERLPVFNLPDPRDRRRLLVKVRAELGSRMILSFIPVTITTDWVESAKFRPPRPAP